MDVAVRKRTRVGEWDAALPDWDGADTLVLAFWGEQADIDDECWTQLRTQYPTAVVMGCSTAGTIAGTAIDDDQLVVTVVRFEQVRLAGASFELSGPAQSVAAGRQVVEQLVAGGDDLRAIFVLSDGQVVNGSALAAGLTEGRPPGVTVTGGLAGHGTSLDLTEILVDGRPATRRVTAVGLYGAALDTRSGTCTGWSNFGPERRVTRSDGNLVYEFDGRPSLELYRNYLGERATELTNAAPSFPLAVRLPEAPDRELVRTVIAIDEHAQALRFAGDVPQGARARLMHTSVDGLLDDVHTSARAMGVSAGAHAPFALAVSCGGRRRFLGAMTPDELDEVADGLPADTVMSGFYSGGEISSSDDGPCELHNQTLVLTSWRELV